MAEQLGLSPPKILIVSNRQPLETSWNEDLQPEKLTVVLESNPASTVQRWEKEIPDVILLDLELPEDAILDLIERLRAETLVPILLLTSSRSEEFILETYRKRVDECMVEPISRMLFQAKIKVWVRRSWNISANTLDPLRVGKLHLFPTERTIFVDEKKSIRLTNLELRLLYFLMGRPNLAVSIEELNQRVWGYSGENNNTMLKNVVYRLRLKIEADPAKPHFIKTVVGAGYKLNVD